MSSNARKLAKGSGLGVAYLFLQISIAFFMMPFLIKNLGKDTYAIWILLGTFIGYYGFLDLGIGAAVTRFVSKLIGAGKDDENKYITSTAFYIFLLIGIVICIISFFISFFITDFLKIIRYENVVRTSILIMGIGLGVSFPLRVFDGILNATLRIDIKRIVEITEVLIKCCLIIYVVKSGYGLIGMAIISATVIFLGLFARTIIAFYIYPYLSINPRKFRKSVIRKIMDFGFYNFIQKISMILNTKLDSFVIAYFVNLTAVTYYGVVLRMVNYFISLFYIVLSPFGPLVSQKEGANDYRGIKEIFLFITKIMTFAVCFAGSMVLLYAKNFIVMWLGESFLISYKYLIILFVPLILYLSFGATAGFFLNYSGRHRYVAITNLLEGVLNLIISLVLVHKFGVIGVALGTAISGLLFGCIIRPIKACKYIGVNAVKFYKETFRDFSKIILLVMFMRLVLNSWRIHNYLDLLIVFLLNSIVILPVMYLVLLTESDRTKLNQIFIKS